MEDFTKFVEMKVKEEPMDHQGSSSHFPSSSGVDGVRSHSVDVKEEDVSVKDEPIEEVDPIAVNTTTFVNITNFVNTTTFTPNPESTWTEDSAQHGSKPHIAGGSTAPLHVATSVLPQEPAADQDDSGSDTDKAAKLEERESSVGGCTMESRSGSQSITTKSMSSGGSSTKKRGMKRDRSVFLKVLLRNAEDNPVVPSLSPDPDSVPGLQQARANSAKARNEHRAALLEEIRDQGTSFKEMVSSALASTHVKEDPPALQYWKEVLNPIANDCVAIGERYRSDLLAEIAALITRWKRLAATGVEAAPPEFMVNMIASVGGARQPPTAPPIQQPAMEAVPLGVMGMVPGATPMLHIPSDTNVFRPQQQVVQQPKVLHRPLSSSTPYETNNTSLQSFGIPASFVVDNLPSFSVNTPTSQSAPPTTLHTTSNTVNTPNK